MSEGIYRERRQKHNKVFFVKKKRDISGYSEHYVRLGGGTQERGPACVIHCGVPS